MAVLCYLRGTRIRTPKAERRIEDLKIGDPVVTLFGESKPIKWIGHRRYEKRSDRWVKDIEPIRISRFALDERTPHKDLYVSPGHAIYVDGALIKAVDLVNGLSITQCAPEGLDTIEYFHVELFAHDVIYAEGAAAETFWPFWDGSHDHFDNFAEYHRLYPDQGEPTPRCAPLLWEMPGRIERTLRVVAPWIDTRKSVGKTRDKIRDQFAERAKGLLDA